MNARLAKRLTELDERVADWCEKNPNQLTVDVLKALLDGSPMTSQDRGVDFGDYVRERLKAELDRNKNGQSVYKNGLSTINIFGIFLKTSGLGTYKPDGIYISEITPILIEKCILWRKEVKGNTEETINHALTPILKACQKAMIEGYISTQVNGSIQDMRIAKPTSLEGGEKEEVSQLLGHSSTEITEKVYAHYIPAKMQAEISKINLPSI